jgi:hypothetical protein
MMAVKREPRSQFDFRRQHGAVVVAVETREGRKLDDGDLGVLRARETRERVIDALYLDALLWTAGEDASDGDRRYGAARWLLAIYGACRFPAPRAASYGERSGAGGLAGLSDEEVEEMADARAAYRVAMGVMGLAAGTVRDVVCLDAAFVRHSPRLGRTVWEMWRLDALRGGLDAIATMRGMR